MDRSWILVSGPGHAGTRLLARILARHPDVTLPEEHLTVAWELKALHQFFITALDETGLHEPDLAVDVEELAFILEAYEEACPPEGDHVLLKMPHYPLLSLEAFASEFDLEAILYTERPVDKIYQSNLKRGKDILHTQERPYIRQVKKCRVEDRGRLVVDRNFEEVVRAQVAALEERVEAWNEADRRPPIQRLQVEDLTSDPNRFRAILEEMGLEARPAEEMLSIVDSSRLEQRGLWYRFKQRQLKLKNRLQAVLRAWR